MENVIIITNKFIDQIQALYIMAEKEVIKKPTLEKDAPLDEIFDFLMHYKTLQTKNELTDGEGGTEVTFTENEIETLLHMDDIITKNELLKHLVENVNIEVIDGDEYYIKTTSALASSLSKKYASHRRYLNTENDIYINSLVMSLVTSFELLVSDLIKDYALSNKNPNFFNSDKIDYKTLTQIGDIDTAKEYLIDRYLEGILRGSVTDWLGELESISNNINFNELAGNKKLLIETFQRRHLLVHNNGIVNNLYLSKVDLSLTKNIAVNTQLETTKEYIEERINTIREIGLLLSFKYFTTVYKESKDEIYQTFQEHIIQRIPKDCNASASIFSLVMKDNKYSDGFRLLAKINYWLVKKFNSTFQEVEEEVKKFDVSTLMPHFQMAKYLLLDEKNEGFKKFVEYSKTIEIDDLFYSFEWPILKLLGDYKDLQDFKKVTIDSLYQYQEEKEETLHE